MKFDYNDVPTFNLVLVELYRELPENLRLQGQTLSAVDVLIEVVEYLRFLKKTTSKILVKDTPVTLTPTNPAASTTSLVTPKAGPVTPTGSAVTPTGVPISAMQRLIQNSAQEGPSGQRKFVQNDSNKPQTIYLPPGGKLVHIPGLGQVIQLPDQPPPKGPNYKPTVLQLQPGAKVAIAKESSLKGQAANVATSVPPVKTILGQRPRPLLPAPSKAPMVLSSSVTGLRNPLPTSVSGGQSVLRTQQPITIMAKDPSGVTRPITIMANPGSTAASSSSQGLAPIQPKFSLPTKMVNGQPHAVFCRPDCACPLNDESVPIPAATMTEMFEHLENAIMPNALWSNFTAMKSYENRKYLYTSLILKLKRTELHSFLRVVAMSPQRGTSTGSGCIPFRVLEKDPLGCGMFEPTRGACYSIILTLFHLFRRYDGTGSDSDAWVITSKKECRTLSCSYHQPSVICINPWHFERTDSFFFKPRETFSHVCEIRLRIFAHKSIKYVCPICQTTLKSIVPLVEGPKLKKPAAEPENNGFLKIANSSSLQTKIKEEPMDVTEQPEGDQLEDVRPQIKIETNEDDPIDQDMDGNVASNHSQSGQNEEEREEDVDDPLVSNRTDQEQNGESQKEMDASDEPPKSQDVSATKRCQHCLAFPEKDAPKHQCMVSDKDTATFACHYCGYCDNDLENIQSHVSQCRSFGLSPRFDIGLPKGHPRYPAKNRKPCPRKLRTCPECRECFVTVNEFEVHKEGPSCKSYHCPECLHTFVSKRSHCCLDYQLEASNERENISVILVDPPFKGKAPVTCQTCQKLLADAQVYSDHKAKEARECEMCSEEFESLCQLLTHSCDYLQVML